MTPANTFYIALGIVLILIIFSCLFGSCRQTLEEPFYIASHVEKETFDDHDFKKGSS